MVLRRIGGLGPARQTNEGGGTGQRCPVAVLRFLRVREVDEARADRVIQLALAAAAGEEDVRGRELGPIHLLKYVYLADLAHAEAHSGETFTGAPWRFHHYGPWAVEVFQRIEPAVAAVRATERRFASKYDKDGLRYSVGDGSLFDRLERGLPLEVVSAVRRAVHEHGSDTESLLRTVYTTVPMLRAAPGEWLDFALAVPAPAPAASPEAGVVAEPVAAWKRRRAHAELRERVQEQLAERLSRRRVPVSPAPRYDDVFAAGVRWLDSLAGPRPPEGEAEAVFSDDIWKSTTRGGRDLP